MNGKLRYYLLAAWFLLFAFLVIFRPPEILAKIIFFCLFVIFIFGFVLTADFVISGNIEFFRKFFKKNKTDDEAEQKSTE